jgi:hypothetical protein
MQYLLAPFASASVASITLISAPLQNFAPLREIIFVSREGAEAQKKRFPTRFNLWSILSRDYNASHRFHRRPNAAVKPV